MVGKTLRGEFVKESHLYLLSVKETCSISFFLSMHRNSVTYRKRMYEIIKMLQVLMVF